AGGGGAGRVARGGGGVGDNRGGAGRRVQKLGGRAEIPPSAVSPPVLCATMSLAQVAAASASTPAGRTSRRNAATPLTSTSDVYSPALGRQPLPSTLVWMSERRSSVAICCSTYSGWPSSTTSTARLEAQKAFTSSGTSG